MVCEIVWRAVVALGSVRRERAMRVWVLFVSTFAISMTANTGYAILAAMRTSVCDRNGWLDADEMDDCVALAQSAPGPIAVNASVAVGWQVAGLVGALSAVLGCVLPPFLSIVVVSLAYERLLDHALAAAFLKGMQFGVVALLIDVLVGLGKGLRRQGGVYSLALVVASFLYVRFVSAPIAWLALFCAAFGVARVLIIGSASRDVRR